MFLRYRSQGIIIKKEDRGESDQFFTVYTKDFGKIKVLGKSIRKISSKLRAGVGLFYFSEIEFIQGRNYKTLVDSVVVDKFKNIRGDLEKTIIAHKIVEVFDKLIQGQEKDISLFDLLLQALIDLDSNKNQKIVYYYFLWSFLSLLGYSPNLYNCSICQNKLEYKKNYFNLEGGGIICFDCFLKERKGTEISPSLIKVLRIILKNREMLFNLKIQQKEIDLLRNISQKYLLSFIKTYE